MGQYWWFDNRAKKLEFDPVNIGWVTKMRGQLNASPIFAVRNLYEFATDKYTNVSYEALSTLVKYNKFGLK